MPDWILSLVLSFRRSSHISDSTHVPLRCLSCENFLLCVVFFDDITCDRKVTNFGEVCVKTFLFSVFACAEDLLIKFL